MEMTKEMISTAKWVAELMAKDGITPQMLKNEGLRAEAVEAYMMEIGRKIEKIQTKYITCPEAREAFQAQMYAEMKG